MTKKGAARYDLADPYHLAVTLNWPQFFLSLLAIELAVNLVFAGLYLLQPGSIANAAPGSLVDAFFFSLETLATVGYGVMSPATQYAHILSALEILCGMTLTAIFTGLIFVRFSRPKSKLLFADQAVIGQHNGQPTLMIRVAHGRLTMLSDAKARLHGLFPECTAEGQFYRRSHDLALIRPTLPVFALTWTIMHTIDAQSPLYGYGPEKLFGDEISLFLAVEARDHTLASEVYAMKAYRPREVRFGMRYTDTIFFDDAGGAMADLTLISAMEVDPASPLYPPAEPNATSDQIPA